MAEGSKAEERACSTLLHRLILRVHDGPVVGAMDPYWGSLQGVYTPIRSLHTGGRGVQQRQPQLVRF